MTAQSIRVRTGSRLHFGLLSIPGTEVENRGRSFGGVGLMIDEPAIRISTTPASGWSSSGPSHDRALAAAKRALPTGSPPVHIQVEACPDQHTGLGTGTQLAMAAGLAACRAVGICPNPLDLAGRLGRGLRSGLGVHGFLSGGLVVDGGKGAGSNVAPLIVRHDFPDQWRVLLAAPVNQFGLSGDDEIAAFDQLGRSPADVAQTESLCRLVLLGILPALIERDLEAFGDAVFEFNRRAGLLFKSSQRGEYRSPQTAALIAQLRSFGIHGVGQSSWGPTVFGLGELERLEHAASRLAATHPRLAVRIVAARNRGWEESTQGEADA